MRYTKPTAPDKRKVIRLFEEGLTREEVAARMNRKDSARLYQMWLDARGCPTPRMLMVEKMERFGLDNLEVVSHTEPTHQRHCEAVQHEKAREAKRPKMKRVFDVTTGSEYESINDAARQTGLCPGNISACCNNKRSHTGGHTFRYIS